MPSNLCYPHQILMFLNGVSTSNFLWLAIFIGWLSWKTGVCWVQFDIKVNKWADSLRWRSFHFSFVSTFVYHAFGRVITSQPAQDEIPKRLYHNEGKKQVRLWNKWSNSQALSNWPIDVRCIYITSKVTHYLVEQCLLITAWKRIIFQWYFDKYYILYYMYS